MWRDPSLRTHKTILGSGNLDPNSIVNIATDNPATEPEGSETTETAVQRFTASGAAFNSQEGPIEAGFAERVPTRPVESPPKRPRVNIRISQVQRNIKPLSRTSYAGWSKIEGTKASAEYLIDQLNREGLPFKDFKEVHFSRAPCGREGKSSIVSALQAYCLVDDRQDILNENYNNYTTGIKVIKSECKRDKELSWIVLIDHWLRQEGIESILQRHRPIPLRPEQFYPPHGGKQNKDCW